MQSDNEPPTRKMEALLVLADGTAIHGIGGGAPGVVVGELVFQTGMVGYQEALTDPSYAGQLLIFTYPLVGNYGAGPGLSQSGRIHARGVVVRDLAPGSGHRDTVESLDRMLFDQSVPAISGVDTRFLTRRVRTQGVVPAALAAGLPGTLPSVDDLLAMARALDYDSIDFVRESSTPELVWHPPARTGAPRIALVDYGAKAAMLDHLRSSGAGVWVVPATMPAADILSLHPSGVLLSNGPGDPGRLDYAVNTVRDLVSEGDVPVFGICLGHQLLGLAAGASTVKMRFGHRGINQPVLETSTGRVVVTTQNHGYMVDAATVPGDYIVTHTNLNDNTVEGIAHRERPVWGVQWHPEARPGPTDTRSIIDRLLDLSEPDRA
jgi:carbamoyl-phosphate synthase small subunit